MVELQHISHCASVEPNTCAFLGAGPSNHFLLENKDCGSFDLRLLQEDSALARFSQPREKYFITRLVL